MASETRVIPERVDTGDGSPTYLHPGHGASYRSTNGAATESRHVFLEGSRVFTRPGPWRVLELGFGSGLNFEITRQAAQEAGVELRYVSLEPDPMPADLWLVEPAWREIEWGRPTSLQGVSLTLHGVRWQDFEPAEGVFDAVYHDPFGPAVAPECWSVECFRWAARALARQGVLSTYGASSGARRAMREAGLLVGILPGAPGKREMTVASYSLEALGHARLWKTARPG